MKKLTLLLAVGIGYVLGARAGRARYDQIKNLAADPAHEPTRKKLAEQLARILTDAGDPRLVEKDCRFEKLPFTDAPPRNK